MVCLWDLNARRATRRFVGHTKDMLSVAFSSGVMVALTFFEYLYIPLKWVGLGTVAVGIPPL